MSVTSLSFTFVNTCAPTSARPAAASAPAAAPAQSKDCDGPRPVGRQNRLVQAMMSALRELGFGAAPNTTTGTTASAAAPATTAPTGTASGTPTGSASTAPATPAASTTTAPAPDAGATATPASGTNDAAPAATLDSAVQQFAHALFQALRQGGGDGSSKQGSGEHGHGHHHHGHHGWGRQGYDDMAQRLESLAQSFTAPTPAAASSVTVTPTLQEGAADTNVQATGGSAAAPAVGVATPAAATTATPASAASAIPAKNPLLEAFTRLFGALKPASAATTAPAEADMAAKLRSFLHTLAQALDPHAAGSNAAVGTLVNVTA